MKLFSLTVASALQLATVMGSPPKCNPAVHCPSISIECLPCNPRTSDNCDVATDTLGRGLCVEPAALDYKKDVYGMKYDERCRRVVDPSWEDAKPKPGMYDYIHSCREGHYTCNDGTCELAKGFPKECYKGVYNIEDVAEDRFKCNYAKDTAIFNELTNFWFDLEHDKYCKKNGGVRFGPLRCDRSDITLDVQSCPPGSEPKVPTCEEQDGPITLFGPADACTATCSDFSELYNSPGCCANPDKPNICSTFTVYQPNEDVARCDADELEEGCEICQQSVEDGYYYCCLSEDNPTCVDENGLMMDGKKSNCAVKAKNGGGLKNDVCYVDSQGSSAEPPKISDTGFGASGIELTFKFEADEDLPADRDCCCDLICSCFGDPHCTSFFGDYEVSQEEEGTYLMVHEKDGNKEIKVIGHLSEPLGISGQFDVQLGDMNIEVLAEPCVYGEGIYVDGELVSDTSDIDGVEYYRTTDRPTEDDKKPWHKNKNLNDHLAINPSFVFMEYNGYTVEVKCIRFEMSRGEHKGWWNRLDITIRRSVVEDDVQPGCCPTSDTVYDNLGQNGGVPDGFCFRHPAEEGYFLPKAKDLTNSGARRLRATQQAIEEIKGRDLQSLRGVVTRFAELMSMDEKSAALVIDDMGVKAAEDYIKNSDDHCLYYASEEAFDYDPSAHCEGGLVLEAKKPTQDEWIPIKFFPKRINYCDDKVLVIYDHTTVSGNKKLDNTYELRLQTCTPDPQICGELGSRPCQPFNGVKDLGVSMYAYDSTLQQALLDLLQSASEDCECTSKPLECILNCVNTGICPPKNNCP